MGPCNKVEERICTKKRESLSLVQRSERRSERVYLGADEEGVYQTIKVITDYAGILCRKEGWKEGMLSRILGPKRFLQR